MIFLAAVPSPQALSAESNLTNVGLSASSIQIDKERVAFLSGSVLHVFDVKKGAITNVGLTSEPGPQIDKEWVAFLVNELSEGTDLNGDGDINRYENVLHVFDTKRGATTNVGLAALYSFHIDKERVAIIVPEAEQGTDLNSDGDTIDFVLHVFDAKMGAITNVGLAGFWPQIDKERVAFLVHEAGEGTDLNGDGDIDDFVLHVFDAKKGATTNVGLACLPFDSPQIDKERVAFLVSEAGEGTDLNGDGDIADRVLHVFDAKKGNTTNVGVSVSSTGIRIDKERVAFVVSEGNEGIDLNGDGVINRRVRVPHVYDIKKGVTFNLGLAARFAEIDEERVAFFVTERDEGTDLNGDGDTLDKVLHVFDAKKGTTTNLGLASLFGLEIDKGRMVFVLTEAEAGTDLNGDGDTLDNVLHVLDLK